MTALDWLYHPPFGPEVQLDSDSLAAKALSAVTDLLHLLLRYHMPRLELDVSRLYQVGMSTMLIHSASASAGSAEAVNEWMHRYVTDGSLLGLQLPQVDVRVIDMCDSMHDQCLRCVSRCQIARMLGCCWLRLTTP